MFADAIPQRSLSELSFADAANAIVAFETDDFSLEES